MKNYELEIFPPKLKKISQGHGKGLVNRHFREAQQSPCCHKVDFHSVGRNSTIGI